MIVRQYVDADLGCASYLVADEAVGEAVLIDPVYAVEALLDLAERERVRVVRVLETHTHADHVSGHGRLALDHGIPVSIHPDAGVDYAHDPLRDGDEVRVGAVCVRVLHTPGHRPEHCCFAAGQHLFTGDSLFVGAVARPDLAVGAEEGAEGLFSSLRRLLELPDAVTVWPGHLAGSLCGAHMRPDPSTTIGRERRENPMLAIPTVGAFVAESARATAVPRPPNMARIVELNSGPFVGGPPPLRALRPGERAVVIDARPARDFAAGHAPGAFNVPLEDGHFGTKAGFLVQAGETVALAAGDAAGLEDAAARLRAVGFLELALAPEGAAPASYLPLPVEELDAAAAAGAVIVDVREADEAAADSFPGALNVPYRLLRTTPLEGAAGRTVVTICESGARAAIAGSVLAAAGLDVRPVIAGGLRSRRVPAGAPASTR